MGTNPTLRPSTHSLPRHHLDLAVDAGDHLELALIGASLIASDGAIVALGKHDAGEHAGRFLDDVAARRDDRPVGVGNCLAAAFADQLEGDKRGTMANRYIRELAALHPDVGPHHRIGVAVIRDDVIVAFRHHYYVARQHALRQRRLEAGLELAALEDIEGDLAARNPHVADAALELDAAGWKLEHLTCPLLEAQRLGGARQPETDMHHIVAGRQRHHRTGSL